MVVADILNECKEIAEGFTKMGISAMPFQADLSQVGNIRKMVNLAVKEFGRLDILVNNAGVQKPLASLKMTEEVYDWIMCVNLRTPFFCSVEAAKQMKKQGGGVIVNISSGNSRMINVGRAPYCIAKTGINALTAALGAEWGIYGIRVNAVAPGWIKTSMTENGLHLGVINERQIMSVVPLERWGTAHEIADVVCYLASDQASYVTGQTLYVDGGWNAGILPDALNFIKQDDE